MVAVNYILRGNAFFFRSEGNGHSMFIAATNKKRFFSFEAHKARIGISRQVNTG